jgi:hypothetical protein
MVWPPWEWETASRVYLRVSWRRFCVGWKRKMFEGEGEGEGGRQRRGRERQRQRETYVCMHNDVNVNVND